MGAVKLLTLQEAAALLHLSAEGLRRLAKAGKVPGRKAGKRWIFVDEHLVRWLEGDYAVRDQQPTVTMPAHRRREKSWPCTNEGKYGGCDLLPLPANRYGALLEPSGKGTRKNSTTR